MALHFIYLYCANFAMCFLDRNLDISCISKHAGWFPEVSTLETAENPGTWTPMSHFPETSQIYMRWEPWKPTET